jgi:hypothetical protein
MTKPSPSLTKTCSVCGLQKPLSAFLQMRDKEGATYGNVCSTCRHEKKNSFLIGKDDASSTGSTITIDSKAKVKLDTAKEDLFDKIETEYHEERDQNEVIESKETQKTEQIKKNEREHRETFLNRRPVTSSNKQFDTKRVSESRQLSETAEREIASTEKATQQESSTKQEQKEKDVDLTVSTDTQIGKVKFREGESFKAFSARETSSAISRIFNKAPQKPSTSGTTWQQSKPTTEAPKSPEKEGPSEFAEKNWGPRSR